MGIFYVLFPSFWGWYRCSFCDVCDSRPLMSISVWAFDLATIVFLEIWFSLFFLFCCADEEFEHLNWRMRLRIAMGMAYCLEYLHEPNTPLIQLNLTSSAINLTEDYAAKVAECSLQNEIVADEWTCASRYLLNTSSGGPESQIYSFGLVLLELMTGKIPHSAENGSLEEWAIQYLRLDKPLKELVDPTLASFQEEQLEQIGQLLRSCLHSNPVQRPAMKLITARLRSVTGITPDEAIPKLSPLWWAELEIASEAR